MTALNLVYGKDKTKRDHIVNIKFSLLVCYCHRVKMQPTAVNDSHAQVGKNHNSFYHFFPKSQWFP